MHWQRRRQQQRRTTISRFHYFYGLLIIQPEHRSTFIKYNFHSRIRNVCIDIAVLGAPFCHHSCQGCHICSGYSIFCFILARCSQSIAFFSLRLNGYLSLILVCKCIRTCTQIKNFANGFFEILNWIGEINDVSGA